MNAVGYAARVGATTNNTTLYVTHAPCVQCAPVITAAGIKRVVYGQFYKSAAGIERLKEAGVRVEHLET